mgnify:CR=1 FL=1
MDIISANSHNTHKKFCIICEQYSLISGPTSNYFKVGIRIFQECSDCQSYGYYEEDFNDLLELSIEEKRTILVKAKEKQKLEDKMSGRHPLTPVIDLKSI